jgi:hypothetical protein
MSTLTVVALVASAPACSVNRLSSSLAPDATLHGIRNVHVIPRSGDDRRVDRLIAAALGKRGFLVTVGPRDRQPPAAQAVVTYADQWAWDMSAYMLQLTILVEDARTRATIVSATALHTSFSRRSPDEVVDEVLTEILKRARPDAPQPKPEVPAS